MMTHAKMYRSWMVGLFALSLFWCGATTVRAQDDPKKDQQDLQKQVEQLRKDLDALRQEMHHQLGVAQRHIEEELQAAERGVDGRRGCSGVDHVELEGPKILGCGGVWRSLEKRGEPAHGADAYFGDRDRSFRRS